jgi:hypothetical protein
VNELSHVVSNDFSVSDVKLTYFVNIIFITNFRTQSSRQDVITFYLLVKWSSTGLCSTRVCVQVAAAFNAVT